MRTKYRVGQTVWTYDMTNKEPLKWFVESVVFDDTYSPSYCLRYGGAYITRPQEIIFRTAKEAREVNEK